MIERIRARNFRRYRDATVHFKPGVNFIEGLNNVGKTTLFYAIEYALFGRVENFRTIKALVHPDKKSMGVEIVLTARSGERLLLQRVHQMPPRSRKTMEGNFTLKALHEDGEQYLLASDFGDTEDKLAMKLQELTGLTRRMFSVAMHMRQGDIAAILDGAKQLDIVLGVTAASMAEEELRQMALDLEKESAGLPVLQERVRALGAQLSAAAGELATATAERKKTAEQLDALGEASGPRADLEQKAEALTGALATLEERHRQGELARQRVNDERERWEKATQANSVEAIEKELASIEAESAARAGRVKKAREQLAELDKGRRPLDHQRGDLAGRIERRRALPTGEGATCEACGAPIDAAHTAEEVARWTAEVEELDRKLEDLQQRRTTVQSAIEKDEAEERKQRERASRLADQREQLANLQAGLAKREKELAAALASAKEVSAQAEAAVKAATPVFEEFSLKVSWDEGAGPASAIASVQKSLQGLHAALAERAGRQAGQRQALVELLGRFDQQLKTLQQRQADLEREQAGAVAEANTQQAKALKAERFRRLAAGFKSLQAQIRAEAASKLARDTLALHRQLSERDEFVSLSIDPASYAVQVVPRDLGEEVPAALYEGGGHRLLLGLAFRLAVAKLVEHCPFLMLDEPTYGLDAVHREALLNRIASQDVTKQILLVTHQAMGDVPGHRVRVVRQGRETVVAGPAA